MLVSRTLAALAQGEIKQEDRLYPITRMERYTRPTKVVGVGSSSGMETRYALLLRAEFVPDGRHSGSQDYPIRDIYMKVLPKGTANVSGVLLGFPVLDLPPHGLGHQLTERSHYFAELGVHLPRGELYRRSEMRKEVDALASNREHDVTLATRDGYLLMAEALREWDSPCAYSDADAFVLQPGEEAMIPARWSGKIPQQDFVCEPWPSLEEGLEVLPGLCAGGEPELMMCLANRAEVPVTVDPGASLAGARLPEKDTEYHRLGPNFLTGRPGERVLEHEGALMEVWSSVSEF